MKKYLKLFRVPLTPVYRLVVQPLAFLFLPLVVRLPQPPDFWTFCCLLAKLAAGGVLIYGGSVWWFVGLLLAGMVFDSFVGAVARWREKSSYRGAYLDRAVDRLGASWILSCFLIYLFKTSGFQVVPMLLVIILLDIWHDTLRTWVALTGGLLGEEVQLPSWDRWLRSKGLLPIYGHDTLFACLAVGVLFGAGRTAAAVVLVLVFASFFYQIYLHSQKAASSFGGLLWKHMWRWILNRTVGVAVSFLLGLFIAELAGISWLIAGLTVWAEFIIFYLKANQLLSLSAEIPGDEAERSKYIDEMKNKDMEFLGRMWP